MLHTLALKEPVKGTLVPHFELCFFLTMESIGRVHPTHRVFNNGGYLWESMSEREKEKQRYDMVSVQIESARKYGQNGIMLSCCPWNDFEETLRQAEIARELSGDEFFLAVSMDPTFAIPDGNHLEEFVFRLADDEQGVKDEAELSAYAGELSSFGHYDSALAAAGERTRETYREIEKVCRKNAEISREIGKGRELLRAGMLADGLAYAEEMVRRYPAYARARELLIEAKCLSDENYSPFADLEFFKACPDASVAVSGGEEDYYGAPKNISPVIAERCKQVAGRRMSRDKLIGKYLIRPLLVLIAVGALVGVWFLIDSLFGR